jgi:peptide/nickel transport system ATP-binding protein
MAFESLSEKLGNVFRKLKGRGKLTETDIKSVMREIRLALLAADVNYGVAKDFTAKVSERALGADVLESLTPAQQVIKIVNEELTALMGEKNDKIRSIRGKEISMIFQEPMVAFSPMYTIGNQINEATLLHITKDKKKAKEISMEVMRKVGIANVEKRYNQYPHEFSGGMLQRALIAMALVCNPKLLIADEPTTALDVTVQAQILELMKELQKDFDTSILFITHDLGVVAKMCDRVAVMYLGKIVESADAKEIYANPQHPYTRGLIGSVHKIGAKKEERLFSIEGTVPLAMNLPKACGFYDRCDARIEGLCDKAEPELVEVEDGHKIACFNCPHEACRQQRERVEALLREEEGANNG